MDARCACESQFEQQGGKEAADKWHCRTSSSTATGVGLSVSTSNSSTASSGICDIAGRFGEVALNDRRGCDLRSRTRGDGISRCNSDPS